MKLQDSKNNGTKRRRINLKKKKKNTEVETGMTMNISEFSKINREKNYNLIVLKN